MDVQNPSDLNVDVERFIRWNFENETTEISPVIFY